MRPATAVCALLCSVLAVPSLLPLPAPLLLRRLLPAMAMAFTHMGGLQTDGDYFSYYKDYAELCASAHMAGRSFFTFYEVPAYSSESVPVLLL